MASIEELVAKISAARDALSRIGTGIATSLRTAGDLADQFQALGTTDKTAQLEAIKQAMEGQQAQLAAAADQAEHLQARAEALRGDQFTSASSIATRDLHGSLRRSQREVDIERVWTEGTMYYQDDGQLVKILDSGDGTYQVVIKDPANSSGAPTTVIDALTERQLSKRLDRGRWF